MASDETLEEKKAGDAAPVAEASEEDKKSQSKGAEEKEEQSEEQDEEGDSEDNSEEDAGGEESKGKVKKVEEEEDNRKKAKGGRKGSSRKAPGGEAVGKKPRQSAASKGKEPLTPIERPTRERKTVERYSAPSSLRSPTSKVVSIEKGRGTQLKDIPNVSFKLSKKKPDDNLQMLHTILFGKKAKVHNLKRNIGQFSGYVWVESELEKQRARVKDRLDKCVKERLLDFCDVLNIQVNKTNVRKEELSTKLLEFLESPHATTDVILADKDQKGKKRKRRALKGSGELSVETSSKKLRKKPQTGEKRKRTSKLEEKNDDDAECSDSKDISHDEDDNVTTSREVSEKEDSESEEEDELKEQKSSHSSLTKKNVKAVLGAKTKVNSSPVRKGGVEKSVSSAEKAKETAAISSKSKGSAGKKPMGEKKTQKDIKSSTKEISGKKESSKSSTEHEGKSRSRKKAKVEPSREEMHAVVVDILKKVDFNTATLSDILRQLGTHFSMDLMHRKAEVKSIITDVINSMSDDEQEEEEAEDEAKEEAEENSEPEDGAKDKDKDEDKDNDA